eukprot:1067710-Rhodomonas_salina.2
MAEWLQVDGLTGMLFVDSREGVPPSTDTAGYRVPSLSDATLQTSRSPRVQLYLQPDSRGPIELCRPGYLGIINPAR